MVDKKKRAAPKGNGATPGMADHPLRGQSAERAAEPKASVEQAKLPIDHDGDQVVAVVEREIEVAMVEGECERDGILLARHMADKAALQDEIAAYAGPRKKKIAKLDLDIGKLWRDIGSQTKKIMVTTETIHNFHNRRVVVRRKDTGDVLEDRGMTPKELEDATFAPPPLQPPAEPDADPASERPAGEDHEAGDA